MFLDTIENPVGITAAAREQIVETLRANKIPDTYGLRVGVRGGGCGASWLLGFDQPGPADQVFHIDGVRVIIDKKHFLYILGLVVDYEVGDGGSGFTMQKTTENSTDATPVKS